MCVVLFEGVDDGPLNMRGDALCVELVRSVVFGVQTFPSPAYITLIDVGVAQLDDVYINE